MKQITVWKSDDGNLHENADDAAKADVDYWKKRALEAEKKIPRQAPQEHRMPYAEKAERGGHQ